MGQAALAVSSIAFCDHPGCDRPAVLGYQWEWGEKGVRCAEHSMLLQQTAEQINRRVSVFPLQNLPAAPLQRDERVALIAGKLGAEAELEEVKARGANLYQSNVDLTRQVTTLTMQHREARALVEDRDAMIEKLEAELLSTRSNYAELVQETERLRTLQAFTPAPQQRGGQQRGGQQRGGGQQQPPQPPPDGPTVVDGPPTSKG